jgi:hypothetical protein
MALCAGSNDTATLVTYGATVAHLYTPRSFQNAALAGAAAAEAVADAILKTTVQVSRCERSALSAGTRCRSQWL